MNFMNQNKQFHSAIITTIENNTISAVFWYQLLFSAYSTIFYIHNYNTNCDWHCVCNKIHMLKKCILFHKNINMHNQINLFIHIIIKLFFSLQNYSVQKEDLFQLITELFVYCGKVIFKYLFYDGN